MKTKFILATVCLFFGLDSFAQKYKQMMADPSFNFYDVCKAADAYFESHSKGKGSGYVNYLRWKNDNESRFYPTGDRNNVNFRIAAQNAAPFLKEISLKGRNTSTWTDLGPYSANNITHGYNPGIGRVECFYVNPSNPNILFLGSRSGGFWRSTNGGQNWVNTTDTLVSSGVNQIAVSPLNPNHVVINVRNGQNGTSHGLFASMDGGLTWVKSNFNPDNLGFGGLGDNFRIYKLAINPLVPDSIFIGSSRGMFKSDLALTQWSQNLASADITDIEFHPLSDSLVYAYDNYYWSNNGNKIMISTDGGTTYGTSNAINGNNSAEGFIATTIVAPDRVYFASDNGVWKSDDMGVNFQLISQPDGSCDGFAVSDVDTLNMVYGYLDQYASWDGGQTFIKVAPWANSQPDQTYTHADLRTAECVNGVFYIGTDGYLCKSVDNGNSWDRLNDGTGIREFYSTGVCQGEYRTFMAGSQDNGTSILDYSGWLEWNGGDGMEAIIHPLNPFWMIGSWQYGTRNYTNDGGLTREGCDNPSRGSDSASWEAPLFFDPNNAMKVYHFGTRLGISEDFGKTWYYGPNHGLGAKPTRANIAYNNSQIMVAAKNGLVRVTTDAWQTNQIISQGLPNLSVTDLTFAPNNDSIIIATFNSYQNDGNKVFITQDLGQTWTNITYNLSNLPVLSVVVDHSEIQNIYVGTEIGVYSKPLSSTSWSLLGVGMPNVPTRDLDIHWGSNTLKASTWGRGLWEHALVNREVYPQILTTGITNPPREDMPKAGYDQFVSADVESVNGLENVYVKWSLDSTVYDNQINMSLSQGNTYVSDDPFPYIYEGTRVFFKVFAEDVLGNLSETHKFTYLVKEGRPNTGLGISNLNENELDVFPNPTKGKLYVGFNSVIKESTLSIYSTSGALVHQQKVQGQGVELFINQPEGIYTLVLEGAGYKMVKSISLVR